MLPTPPDEPVRSAAIFLPAVEGEARRMVLDTLDAMRDALPEVSVSFSGRYVEALESLDLPVDGRLFALPLPLVETCLDGDRSEASAELLAQLVFFSAIPVLPELMALQVAFGWRLAEEHVRDLSRIISRAKRRGLTTDDYVAALAATGDVPDTRSTRCFRGESHRQPDRARVARGIALFRLAAAHAPEALRPSLLCVVAWLLWAIGKRPLALAHLAEASRVDPPHVLVHGLTMHFASNQPGWLSAARGSARANGAART